MNREQGHSGSENLATPISDIFVWDRQFETGMPELDQQHRKLVQLINTLGRILAVETDPDTFIQALFAVFDELVAYVAYHFKFEEDLMNRFNCDREHEHTHKRAHIDFTRRVNEARESANSKPAAVTAQMLTFLSKWLMTHIVVTDMRMARKILAIQSGLSEEEATFQASNFMSNVGDELFQAMNRLYDNLASRTNDLLEAKRKLDQEMELRKFGEIELRKLSRAVEHSPVSIIITDAEGILEYVNPKFTQITGYTQEELVGKTSRILKSGEMPDSVYKEMWDTISSGREWQGELINRKKDGELYWDSAAISPVFDAAGRISHYISIQEDITGRKLAEEGLRQQKQFSDDIINSLPGIFYMLDQEGRFIRQNPQFYEVTGYTEEELRQMTALDFFEGDDQELIAQRVMEVFESGDSNVEAEMVIKSGRKIPYYFTGHRTLIEGQPYLVGLGIDITRRRELEQELMRQARTDDLTGLFNRRHFLEEAEQELVRAVRYEKPLSVLMFDIDEFKLVNDKYGHQAGDSVLCKVAEACRRSLRGVDIIGRMGGEEFAVLLPETDIVQACEVAERLRQDIAGAATLLEQGDELKITVSIGVTTLVDDESDIDKLLNLADKALYEAKRSGRNCVCTG